MAFEIYAITEERILEYSEEELKALFTNSDETNCQIYFQVTNAGFKIDPSIANLAYVSNESGSQVLKFDQS